MASPPVVSAPYPIFFGVDGAPLDGGFIYVGEPNLNPETSPKAIFWDPDLVYVAPQPIRTTLGYASRNGSIGRLFADGDYSIVVRDSSGVLVYSSMNSFDRLSGATFTAAALAFISESASAAQVASLGAQPIDGLLTALAAQNVAANQVQAYSGPDAPTLLSTGTSAGNIPLVGVASATDAVAGLVELATDAETVTGTNTTLAVTPAGVAAAIASISTGLASGTAKDTSTGATSYTFTSLPAGIKVIHVQLYAVSTSGSSVPLIQFGNGTPVTSGYSAGGENAGTGFSSTAGIPLTQSPGATNQITTTLTFRRVSGNLWVYQGVSTRAASGSVTVDACAGRFDLGVEVDLVRLTTAGGTDTFDGGLFNIQYEA